MIQFIDRVDAGEQLVARLGDLRGNPGAVVLGIPRGGVVVAYTVARDLGASLDVALSRKIGAPDNPELAIGAVAENGSRFLDEMLVGQLRVPDEYIERATEIQRQEIARRAVSYRGQRRPIDVRGKVAVVVDDGIATGSTMIVTLRALREQGVAGLIAAAPVIAGETLHRLERLADRIVYVHAPGFFMSVGSSYREFEQVSDAEVRELVADLAEMRS